MPVPLTIDQAAAALGVSRPTIRRRLRNGQLVGSRVPTPQGFVWEVLVDSPADSPPEESATPRGVSNETTEGTPLPGGAGQVVSNEKPAREVELLQAHVHDLRRALEDRTREVQELHVTINRLLLALPAPTVSPAIGGDSGDGPAADGVHTVTTRTQNGAGPHGEGRRRWWQRVLWG